MRSWLARSVTSQKSETIESWISGAAISEIEAAFYREQAAALNQGLELLRDWISNSIAEFSTQELFASYEGVQLFLDNALPGVWDFTQDIVVLHGKAQAVLYERLLERGQRKFVRIVCEDSELGEGINKSSTWESTLEALLPCVVDFVSGSSHSTEQFSVLVGEEIPSIVLIGQEQDADVQKDYERIFKSVSAVLLGKKSVKEWPVIFTEQWLRRLPELAKLPSATSILSLFEGRDIVIASPGPSLYESLSALEKYRDRFLLVSPIRSLLVLLEAGITPDFAFQVDASDFSGIIPNHIGLGKVSLICTDYCHHSVFNAGFKQVFTIPDSAMIGNPINVAFHGKNPPVLQGGCVATCAVGLVAQLDVNSITLVGQDLSISRGRYVQQAPEDVTLQDDSRQDDDYLTCKGIDGTQLRTQEDYLWYIGEMENAARFFSPNIQFINSTVHGAYLEGWEHRVMEKHPIFAATPDPAAETDCSHNKEDKFPHLHEIIGAIESERATLLKAAKLCSNLVELLSDLVRTGDNDVTEVEALEENLAKILGAKGSLLKFYTSRFSMALEAASKSVSSLAENLTISAEYYHLIGPRAETLASMLGEVLEKFEAEAIVYGAENGG